MDEDDRGYCRRHRQRIWLSEGCEDCDDEAEARAEEEDEYFLDEEE